MIPYTIFFLLFIIPYIIIPFGVTQFEDPKVIIFEVIVILISFITFFIGKSQKSEARELPEHSPVKYLFITLLMLTIADVLFLKGHMQLLMGNVFRMQGIFLIWFMMLFSYISANFDLPKVNWSVYALLLISELLLTLFFLPVNENGRFVGTMGEPNATAAFVIFLWPFIYYAMKDHKVLKKYSIALAFLGVFVTLFLTHSRSAFIAFIIQTVFLFMQSKDYSKKLIITVCLTLLAMSYSLPLFENPRFESRAQIWEAAIAANDSYTKVFIGNGFGNLEEALYQSAAKLNLSVQYNRVDSSHNIFLDWWVQGGLLGILLLSGFIYFSMRLIIVQNKNLEIVLMLGLLTVLSFNPAGISSLIAFWWLIGKGLFMKV